MATKKSADRHYWANGERVELHPSSDFVAIRSDAGEPTAGASKGAASAHSESPREGSVVLAERNLVLVPAAAGDGTLRSGRAAATTARSATVFESDAAAGVYLVPNGEVIVKFVDGTSDATIRKHLAAVDASIVKSDYPETGAYLVTVADADTITAANALHDDELVEYAEPNFVQITSRPGPTTATTMDGLAELNLPRFDDDTERQFHALAGGVAPDPAIASQWALNKIRAIEAWGISAGDPNISVAVIDEGVDMTHEDLPFKLPGFDAYDGDNNPQPFGNDAHGTACAGIVAAIRNNGRGGSGVAPGCKVMPVRIAKGIGGGFWDTDSAKVANAIRTSVDRGADVLSNSYSVGPSTAVTNAFTYAATNGRGGKGCAMAAATGNGDISGVIYPARLSPTIRGFMAVGASNEWDQRKSKTSLDGETWWGSNHGPEVDIVAPGVHIYTTDIMGGAGYNAGNYTPGFNGTSSATPHVAGVMALVLSVDRDLRGWEVEDILKLSAVDLGVAGRDNFTGFGRVDARRALEAASKLWYTITPTVEFIGGKAFMRINARLYNPGINTIRLNSFTLTSHNPDWSSEIDRFEYRPNPGNVLLPRTGQDVRFNKVLLKANGTPLSWSYRWSANWSFTFWRPSAPGFALSASSDSLDAAMAGPAGTLEGSTRAGADANPSTTGAPPEPSEVTVPAGSGQTITISIR